MKYLKKYIGFDAVQVDVRLNKDLVDLDFYQVGELIYCDTSQKTYIVCEK